MYKLSSNEPWRIDITIHNIHYAPFIKSKIILAITPSCGCRPIDFS